MSQEVARSEHGGELLAIIREECSPAPSSLGIDSSKHKADEEKICQAPCIDCSCSKKNEKIIKEKENLSPEEVEKLLKEKEKQLTAEFQKQLECEVTALKERCQFILQNEQVRASYMLREAHRERQEKISALQTQLECKNLAGLMFVMCSERRKSKLEKLQIIEEYTGYIHALQDILNEAQILILNLSRGYKTAARVDSEWREKMTSVLKEFQLFIHDFLKGTPESEQFFFNLPALLSTKAPIEDNPLEDPCECPPLLLRRQKEGLEEEQKNWYDNLDESCRPFVMFGDLEEFKPPERRAVLRKVKYAKEAPRKWKDYVFNKMFLKAKCNNTDSIKDVYQSHLPVEKWECEGQPDYNGSFATSRRTTAGSILDMRGNMGSILRMITQSAAAQQPRATILAARDSMEIASTTKLRERVRRHSERSHVVINVNSSKALEEGVESDESPQIAPEAPEPTDAKAEYSKDDDEDIVNESVSALGSIHNDSMHVISNHVPDKDHKINYEKICPMEECQRMQMDSFIRTLPPYMRANPFTHFEQNYEEYETCTPEQLEVLKQRIEAKKKKNEPQEVHEEDPLLEWTPSIQGVAIQTSDISLSLPPCTCRVPSPTPVSSVEGMMFDLKNLIPVKQALDRINQECFYDNRIEFDRFKVIGEDNDSIKGIQKKDRLHDITKVLKLHPSLLDIFQANAV